MKVLVTGGAGGVGRYVVRELHRHDTATCAGALSREASHVDAMAEPSRSLSKTRPCESAFGPTVCSRPTGPSLPPWPDQRWRGYRKAPERLAKTEPSERTRPPDPSVPSPLESSRVTLISVLLQPFGR